MKKNTIYLVAMIFALTNISVDIFAQEIKNTFKDERDSHIYKTVKIGNQVWMAESLAYKTNKGSWAYDNKEDNVKKYGYLYTWNTAKNVCPFGWRLPSKGDFETLLNYYGGEGLESYEALIVNDSTGFAVTFGGWRSTTDFFVYENLRADFWTVTSFDALNAWSMSINSSHKKAKIFGSSKSWGFSVRCIQN